MLMRRPAPHPPDSASALPPTPAPLRPAPHGFPPSAGPGPGPSRRPRGAPALGCRPSCWAVRFPAAAVPEGVTDPNSSPVGMPRRTVEIAPNSWA